MKLGPLLLAIRILALSHLQRMQLPSDRQQQFLLVHHFVRVAFLEAVAIYGLILGVLGAGWHITLPFFIASAGAMILTFPTEERWKGWLKMVEGAK